MKALLLAAVIAGCVPTAGYQASYPPAMPVHTWVFVNGQELTVAQKTQLEQLVGAAIPPARYWIDAQGNAGLEGQPAQVNLVTLARNRQRRPVSIYSTDTAGRGSSLVSDGNCTIASTPDMTLATGGC